MAAGRLAGLALLALLALAACGKADTDPGPGGVSVGEARALDRAAGTLDRQRLPQEAVQRAGQPAQGASTP